MLKTKTGTKKKPKEKRTRNDPGLNKKMSDCI